MVRSQLKGYGLMRAVRFILIVSLCLLLLANAVRFFTGPGDRRVAEAATHDATYSTKATRQELTDAIAAAHRHLIAEQTVFGVAFVSFCAGIGLTTAAIRRLSDAENPQPNLLGHRRKSG